MATYLNKIVNHDMKQSSDPTHIYMDLSVLNVDDGTKGLKPTHLIFSQTRDKAIITDPSSYYCSIIRFNINTVCLPIMQPSVLLGQTDITKLAYSFTLSCNGQDSQQYIKFAPQDLTAELPNEPITMQDFSTGYYNLQSIDYFINLCNITLATAWKNLATKTRLPSNNPPYILYDSGSGAMIFNLDLAGYDDSLSNAIEVYFNTPCYNLFCSFPTIINSYADPNGKNHKLICHNDNGNNINVGETYSSVQCYTEFNSTPLFSCVQSIVICSSTIPVNPTIVSASSINGTSELINYSGNITSQVITDFELSDPSGMGYKPNISMVPYQYRLKDMFGHSELNTVSFEVYYKNLQGELFPLLVPANASANLKVMFRKKYLGV